jgi:hypothetical protein
MTAARAAARSLGPKCGHRHHEETRFRVEVALFPAIHGFIVSSKDLRRKRLWHRGTLGPGADSATPQPEDSI